jgi:hypothetical protein
MTTDRHKATVERPRISCIAGVNKSLVALKLMASHSCLVGGDEYTNKWNPFTFIAKSVLNILNYE